MRLHPFVLPICSIVIWYGMLIAMLACWGAQGHPIYWFMNPEDQIVYLLDVGATNLRPLFISCAGAQGLLLIITFCVEAYLRFRGRRLIGYFGKTRPIVDIILATIFVIISQVGLLVCSIWEVSHYKHIHYGGVAFFIVCLFVASCLYLDEQVTTGRTYGERILAHAVNFRQKESDLSDLEATRTFEPINEKTHNYFYVGVGVKILWLIVCTCMAIAFGVLIKRDNNKPSAVLEWILCFLYGLFHLSFAYDFLPASGWGWGFYMQNRRNGGFDQYVIPHQKEMVFEQAREV